jgi:alginate O-acetyltransferase complex protein AlgI
MLFNSYEFIFCYLPIVFALFFIISQSSHRLAALWLACASVFFYGWWSPYFTILLIASVIFNYISGYLIGHMREGKKVVLIISIALNLTLLGTFKYLNFFIQTIDSAGGHIPLLNIVLPAGISFFTFTQIAFLVDTYRGIANEYNFIHYLLFVTWFPHLIAGPVLHHKQMMPQFSLKGTYVVNPQSIAVGITLFSLGLFKKVMLADQLALYANPIFDAAANGGHPQIIESWIGALAFTLQLYFDFSGYTDMAIGLSRLFNVKFPLNFNSPYKACNIIDFWRRWHITLSTFLRDYLYIPLGGNRKGVMRRHFNLMATMLLGGLWHGAGWNFVIWGGLHGIYLIINHAWRTYFKFAPTNNFYRITATAVTFVAVVVAWVPFRAKNIGSTIIMLKSMAGFNGISLPKSLACHLNATLCKYISFSDIITVTTFQIYEMVIWIGFGLAIVWCLPNSQEWLAKYSPALQEVCASSRIAWKPRALYGVIIGLMFIVTIMHINRVSEFLYFQF